MAFPLGPSVGQQHQEGGILYEWSGTSWDLVIESYQELVESTVDPTAGDVEPKGTVWRNVTSNEAWEYSNAYGGGAEWVKITSGGSIQISNGDPSTQPDGTSLQEGDVYIDSGSSFVMKYRDSLGFWQYVNTFFDNTTSTLSGSPTNTQDAIDNLATRIAQLTKGLSFFGTYDPSTDNADFTPSSGLVDGPLPVAGPTNQDTYLIVNVDGTALPAVPDVGGTVMLSGDWLISDGTSWTHLDLTNTVSTFTGHPDTPNSYTGEAGKVLKVNATETALEFVDPVDTHSIYYSGAALAGSGGFPLFRDPPTNTSPLQVGDRFIDSDNNNPYVWNGATWDFLTPIIISTSTPTETTPGLLWYNSSISTLFVRDPVANAWVGV